MDVMRLLSMIGKTTPPTELPAMTTPRAKERFRANQCDTTDVAVKFLSMFARYYGDGPANLVRREVQFPDQLQLLEPKTPDRTCSL